MKKTIALFLVFLMFSSAILLLAPTISAHTPPWQITTYAFITAAPNPVGVNQQTFIIMWIDKLFSPESAIGNDYRFHNYNLTIVSPSGKVTTQIFSIVEDTTSAQDYAFIPTETGTYNLYFSFPGQAFTQYSYPPSENSPNGLVNDTYLPSSANTTLTVMQQPLPQPPASFPLPTAFWTRPIYGENNLWWTISSNWLGQGAPALPSVSGSGDIGAFGFASATLNREPGDAIGPLTSHVMWTKPIQIDGGVVGGNTFAIQGDTYFEGSAYQQRYTNPIILDGIIYYQVPLSFYSEATLFNPTAYATDAVNLQTGALVWSSTQIPAGQLSFGYIYDVQNPNQKGVYPPILFTSNFGEAYDANTGTPLFNVTNVPGGAGFLGAGALPETMGPNGEHLRYVLTNTGTTSKPAWTIAQWNSSNLWSWGVNPETLMPAPNVVPSLGAVNGSAPNMFDWTVPVTMPSSATGPISEIGAIYGNLVLCLSGSLPVLGTSSLYGVASIQQPYTYFAININASRGTVGSVMWSNTVNPPPGNLTVLTGPVDPVSGTFVEGYKETLQWVGYNLYTGAKMWGPTAPQASLDYFGNPITPLITGQAAYGNLYSIGYAGILYCYDLSTGQLLWTYGNGGEGNSTYGGLATPFGDYPTFIQAVGNGVIYMVTSEHTVNTPIWKGSLARAVNATNGQEIWTISDYTGEFGAMSYAIADGYATWFNGYDNSIYVVGQGPSQTTVTAPSAALTFGQPVVIRGTVTDTSAGTQQTQQKGDFPNGVPVSSDASMKDWMGYVYQQKPEPTNFTGVPVQLYVLDSNGNHRLIGTATTDTSGLYTLTWTPDISGNYTVYANFAGTNGYWPSSAETSFYVMNQASTSTAPTATPATSVADQYFIPAIAGLFVLIIVVAIVLAILVMRKRP